MLCPRRRANSGAAFVSANAFGLPEPVRLTSGLPAAFIIGLLPPGVMPLSPLPQSGPLDITSTWTRQEQSLLLTVAKKYAFAPTDAQHFSTQVVGFLLSLSGH